MPCRQDPPCKPRPGTTVPLARVLAVVLGSLLLGGGATLLVAQGLRASWASVTAPGPARPADGLLLCAAGLSALLTALAGPGAGPVGAVGASGRGRPGRLGAAPATSPPGGAPTRRPRPRCRPGRRSSLRRPPPAPPPPARRDGTSGRPVSSGPLVTEGAAATAPSASWPTPASPRAAGPASPPSVRPTRPLPRRGARRRLDALAAGPDPRPRPRGAGPAQQDPCRRPRGRRGGGRPPRRLAVEHRRPLPRPVRDRRRDRPRVAALARGQPRRHRGRPRPDPARAGRCTRLHPREGADDHTHPRTAPARCARRPIPDPSPPVLSGAQTRAADDALRAGHPGVQPRRRRGRVLRTAADLGPRPARPAGLGGAPGPGPGRGHVRAPALPRR